MASKRSTSRTPAPGVRRAETAPPSKDPWDAPSAGGVHICSGGTIRALTLLPPEVLPDEEVDRLAKEFDVQFARGFKKFVEMTWGDRNVPSLRDKILSRHLVETLSLVAELTYCARVLRASRATTCSVEPRILRLLRAAHAARRAFRGTRDEKSSGMAFLETLHSLMNLRRSKEAPWRGMTDEEFATLVISSFAHTDPSAALVMDTAILVNAIGVWKETPGLSPGGRGSKWKYIATLLQQSGVSRASAATLSKAWRKREAGRRVEEHSTGSGETPRPNRTS